MSSPPDPESRGAPTTRLAGKPPAGAAAGGAAATRVISRLVGATSIPTPASAALAPGTRLGKYEIIRALGQGGMGQVYVARDVVLGRRVALKLLLPSSDDADLAGRLLAEARATARCQHEHIVVIHEVAEHDGHPFLVLEYLEGEPLDRLLARGAPGPARAVDLMIPVVRALVHAHAHGLVHRDLKPENVFVTEAGTIKVLDFGIAAALEAEAHADAAADAATDAATEAQAVAPEPARAPDAAPPAGHRDTRADVIIGTLPYMSPEQLRGEPADVRSDLWAVGVLIFELVAGEHPLGADPSRALIFGAASELDSPLRSLRAAAPGAPPALVKIVDRCLDKSPLARYQDAAALLADLEACAAGAGPDAARAARAGDDERSPYPGLAAFAEDDAGHFFGRAADVRKVLARLDELPLVAVLGPSGAGKSSFVRAGVAAALRAAGQPWSVHYARPGRAPLATLVELLRQARAEAAAGLDDDEVAARLRAQPGLFGQALRAEARATGRRVLLVVDQLEELYTLVAAPEDRAAFHACLLGAADDPAAPVRVLASMRSDFLDRAGEHPELLAALSRGLVFLGPLGREALREALVRPAEMAGYGFEPPALADEIVDALEVTPGGLPLLSFAAARLWDARDRAARKLTAAGYAAMGGIAGAMAAHADQVVADLPAGEQRLVRPLLRRLVTPERTRAIVDLSDLEAASGDPAGARALVDRLARARLVVVDAERGEPTVEIVHESLISRWPRLARWIEEEKHDVAFAAQLGAAARQWDERGRPEGLLWRGDALDDLRRRRARPGAEALPPRDRAFVDAAFAVDDRARRARRRLNLFAFVLLATVAAAAVIALVWIRGAEREARQHAEQARDEAERALAADRQASAATAQARAAAERQKQAEAQAATATAEVGVKDQDLKKANAALEVALDEARKEAEKAREALREAERETARAHQAEGALKAKQAELEKKQAELEVLLAEKEARLKKLEAQLAKISTDLK